MEPETKPKETIRPMAAFYIFVFLIVCILSASFLHLAIVIEIDFFKSFKYDFWVIGSIALVFLLLPKTKKLSIGSRVLPILKAMLMYKTKNGSFEGLENQVYRQREINLEQDRKIKANPALHFFVVLSIVLTVLALGFLMYYSATGNF